MIYTLRIFKTVNPGPSEEHVELGAYEGLQSPPWVPRQGEFFRFRDPHPPNKPHDHAETAGYVRHIVTVFYGTRVVIEVYITASGLNG